MLGVHEATVSFGEVRALDRASLAVGAGETVAVLGASGSGKTTLLRVVAGLITPDSGTVTWDGADLSRVPTHLRRFGVVFQDFALFPHLDVAGNVGFGLRLAGVDGGELDRRTAAALERVGLGGLGTRRIEALSGGQAQRVVLARTLATEPRLLLLDEPLGSLDPALRRDLAGDLAIALRASGVPALLVTHDTDEAFTLADRVVVLDRGRVTRSGTPEAVWRDPGTATVAALLGHTVVTGPFAGITPEPGMALAVRSDAVVVDPTGGHEGLVIATAFRGPGWVVTVEIAGVTLRVASDAASKIGATVRVRVAPEGVVEVEGVARSDRG